MTQARKRFYLILTAVVLAVGLIYRFAPSTDILAPSRDALFLEAREVAKYRALVQQGRGIEKALGSLKQQIAKVDSGLLKGQTRSLAAVDLQNILTRIAADMGVELKTVRVLRGKKIKEGVRYVEVPVQVKLECSLPQLKGILYRIYASRKYLKIGKIQVMAMTRGKEEGMLSCSMTVSGFMKVQGSDGGAGR